MGRKPKPTPKPKRKYKKRGPYSHAIDAAPVGTSRMIRRARIEAGLTQEKLALMLRKKGLNVREWEISDWEMGKKKPSRQQITAVRDLLGIVGSLPVVEEKPTAEEIITDTRVIIKKRAALLYIFSGSLTGSLLGTTVGHLIINNLIGG
jgi:ribosome-binding protein aMBF1 (putative translation factor)